MSNCKTRQKRSVVWIIPTNDFITITKESTSLSDIARRCGLQPKGSNLRTVKRRLHDENIDYSHIKLGLNSNLGRRFDWTKTPKEKVLTENSHYPRSKVKRIVLSENLIENKCFKCGLGTEWNNEPIVLRLDHINGISNDHRLENLRIVCPNCDSQLPTFCGRQKRYTVVINKQ